MLLIGGVSVALQPLSSPKVFQLDDLAVENVSLVLPRLKLLHSYLVLGVFLPYPMLQHHFLAFVLREAVPPGQLRVARRGVIVHHGQHLEQALVKV